MGVGAGPGAAAAAGIQLQQGLSGFKRRSLYQRSLEGPPRTDSYNLRLFRPGGTR